MHLNKIRQVHTFGHPHQYLLQPPFVKITASRRFLLPLMSVWFLDEGILDHSSLQNISSSVRFDGCLAWTARFKSSHRFSIIFKSGDWDGHSRRLYLFHCINALVDLEQLFGSFSCWNTQLPRNFNFVTFLNIIFMSLLILG